MNASALQALYRFWDREGELLYVGVTMNPPTRWGQHRAEKPWWSEVATVTVENFASRAEVEAAEGEAIASERPRYNVVVPGPPAPDMREAAPAAERRPYRSGGLTQRKDGLWVGTIEAGWTDTGKRRRVTVSSRDKAVAEWKLEQKRRELAKAGARV